MGMTATFRTTAPHGVNPVYSAPVSPRAMRAEDAAFSHALVALAAKLVVVDGAPNMAEYAAFAELFVGADAVDAAKLKTLFLKHISDGSSAIQYARQVQVATASQPKLHRELLERLVKLALADGMLNAAECEWLRAIAAVFHIAGDDFRAVLATHMVPATSPYEVLGMDVSASDEELRAHYMVLVQRLHPDRYQAAGATEATIALLSDQLASVNAAYEAIRAKRAKRITRGFSSAGLRKNHKSAKAVA